MKTERRRMPLLGTIYIPVTIAGFVAVFLSPACSCRWWELLGLKILTGIVAYLLSVLFVIAGYQGFSFFWASWRGDNSPADGR
jgi:hypothetical protein